jgi:Arc/MetJ family transcription regulator
MMMPDIDASGRDVRTTLNIDDELLQQAIALTGVSEKTALVRDGLRALIERETARRLEKLGGSDPGAKAPRRRRTAEH